MKIQDVKRDPSRERKTINMSVRVTKSESKWLSDNDVSPQLLFQKALAELMKEK